MPRLVTLLGVCRDLQDMLDGCGSIGVDGLTCVDTVDLDSGSFAGCPLEGGQKLADGTLSRWKNVLVGASMASLPMENPKII